MQPDGVSSLTVTVSVAVVMGLFIGSFLNVVIYRAPLGLSVSKPRSFCPICDRQLVWWENIPLVSWLALRGRCRTCHQPVSVRYPLVELSTAIIFGLVAWAWHGSPGVAAGYCVLAAGMIAVALVEYSGTRAPLSVAAISTVIGLGLIFMGAGWQGHWRLAAGSLVGAFIALAVYAVLRTTDPECSDRRGQGRSALLLTGCWLGALSGDAIALAGAVWIGTYFMCMLGAWTVTRQPVGVGHSLVAVRSVSPILVTPLVSALAVTMAASLIAGG
jgi:leader peptidase (prepilin peptidase)/N-methyltransferase